MFFPIKNPYYTIRRGLELELELKDLIFLTNSFERLKVLSFILSHFLFFMVTSIILFSYSGTVYVRATKLPVCI